ncbi:MAG: sigma-70 family RNA polymerase sigma factor [Candidatus Brocadiia bacterium]
MSLSDEELFIKFKKRNDLEAFGTLVLRHQKPLINLFCRLTGDQGIAEDLAQEGFLSLVKGCKHYAPKARFTTLLYRIAQNIWFDYLRIKKKNPHEISLEKPVKDEDGKHVKDFIKDHAISPYDKITAREESELLMLVIKELPEEQRLTVELLIFQQLTYSEAAEIMDVPEGTVRSRMNTAITKLKGKLIKDEI